MIKELFQQEQNSINHFFKQMNIAAAEELLHMLYECKGVIIFTGVGKSGLVAKKIALTMSSVGTRALYISPGNALHGDIGMVGEDDIFVMVSKSGESEELFNIIPTLRNKKVKLIGIFCNPKSRLEKYCDFTMLLPLEQELCPFDLVPTVSTTTQMIFGDIMTVALMKLKNFTIDQYAMNHPAGRIGKRVLLKVMDLMIRGDDIPFCAPQDKLVDTLVQLSNKRCGCVLIVDEEKRLQGIFTDGDLRRALQNIGPIALEFMMEDLMMKTPRRIGPECLATEAMKRMEVNQKHEITVLPVVDADNVVVGIIKLHDIVQSGL